MHFKELQMFGFKSFADKTKIKFEPGITAIVGPNGCGKSNISDAIRWVLGEQSAKQLRGSNMGDIIFNGTDNKEPLGFAEVALTLSNEAKFLPIEYDEVIISRRLYRSGESEYLVNKTPVRLKDITDLLAGSGLGVDTYSMVEQGKIGMILSSNPEERRYIFEEASGIIRYKTKKREALRKLEATESNLLRVNDIIVEVKRQISTIERQARKAERYKECFTSLQELDTKYARHQYNQLRKQELDYENNHSDSGEKGKELNARITEAAGWVEDLKGKLASQDSKILEAQSKSMDMDFTIKSNRDAVRLDKERIQELRELQASLKNEIKSLTERTNKLSEKMKGLDLQFSTISENRNEKEALLRQLESSLKELISQISENQGNIKDGKARTVNILADQSKTKNEITRVTGEIHNNQARIRRLRVENQKVSAELAGIEKNLAEAASVVEEVNSKIEDLRRDIGKLDYVLEKDRAEFSEIDRDIREHQNQFHSLQSKLKFLEELAKTREGFSGGTKALLEALDKGSLKISGLEKPLAELINVKRGYEIAVEAVLGTDLEAIVVNGWDAALDAIAYLKQKRLGRSSFINKLAGKDRFCDIPSVTHPAFIGKLLDFVKVSGENETMIKGLLGNVLLVKDITSALEICKDKNMPQDVKLVTPKGHLIANGLVAGGSVNEDSSASLIGRQARIEDTKQEIEKLSRETVSLKKRQLEKSESIARLEKDRAVLVETLRREEISLAGKNSRKLDLEREKTKINDELSLTSLEIEETTETITDLSSREAALKEKLKEVEGDYNNVQSLIAESQAFIKEASEKREGLLVKIAQLKTELTSLVKEESGLKESVDSQRAYFDEQKYLLGTRSANLSASANKEKELTNEIEELEKKTELVLSEKGSMEKDFKVLKDERENLVKLTEKCDSDLKTHQDTLTGVRERIHNIEMEKSQLSFKIENLKNRVKEAYKTELDNVSLNDKEAVNWDDIAARIEEHKTKIEQMGPVSLVAIQEHDELKERYSFLMRQQEDLLQAKDSLLKAIKKINQTTKELFMDTFAKIQVEFKNFFRYLFGGGKAEIMLVDPRDVLESDIEIVVRPPGKKLQSISLLSGGEKALAAIALMFAVFKVKPSPFCLLDEVDAPLDDSNIGRFSKVLEDFAAKTQFIIITHNKRTIGLADIMYGITMKESGISEVVSVKFAKGREEKVLA